MPSGRPQGATDSGAARDRPDVFLSYAREDKDFVEQLTRALVAREKDVWIDVEDIRGGASDWRATIWAGIESATAMMFVLTPDSLASTVCGEELQHAVELNKRIIPVLRRSVDGLRVPESLERPNWVYARPEDDFDASVTSLIDALELDEAWVEQHARLTQRTGEWLRHDRDGSYLLRGTDLRDAERWLDDQGAHKEAPTTQQVTYITASRRAAARRQRSLLGGVGLALVITAVLAVVAVAQWRKAVDREQTARAQALAAQSIAALSLDPEESVQDALDAIEIRRDEPEALYALRKAVTTAGWTSILRLKSRRAPQNDVEFSEDGSRVATAGSDGRVAVWETNTGRPVTVVTIPGRRAVDTVQFNPDGSLLLTASEDGIARVWDSSTGRLVHEFDTTSNEGSELTATWGAHGRRILTAGRRETEVWNAESGARLYRLRSASDDPRTSRMSLNGRRALTAGKGGSTLLWNLQTGGKPTILPGEKGDPLEYSLLSRDGRRAATFYSTGRFCVWVDGRVRRRRCVPGGKADLDVDLSRDGRRVLRSYANGTVEVWDVSSQANDLIAVLDDGGPVSSAQFDREGKYVVTGGDDGVARVWQVKPTKQLTVLRGHTLGVNRARLSPNGSQVATVSDDGSGRLWPARLQAPIAPRWQWADSTAFSPRSANVLVVRHGSKASESGVWNVGTGAMVPLLGGVTVPSVRDHPTWPCGRAAGCSAWSSDGRFVAGVNAAGNAVVWDLSTRKARLIGKRTGTAIGAAFSPDGRRLVVAYADRPRARIWDVATGRAGPLVPTTRGKNHFPFSAQFVANSPWVLTVDSTLHAQLSDPATGATKALSGHVLPAGVALAGNGHRIALAVGTKERAVVRVFSGAGTALRSREAPGGAVSSIAFDGTGSALVIGGQKGTAYVWDARRRLPIALPGTGGEVIGASFSPDDNLVIVTSRDHDARLWDWARARVLAEYPNTKNVRAEFSPDGRWIVLAGKTRLEAVRCYACAQLEDLEQRGRSLLPPS